MRKSLLVSALCIALLAPSAIAHADSPDQEIGVDFRYGNVNVNNPLLAFLFGDDDATLLGLDVHGRFRVADALWVGARLPIAHMRWNEDGNTTLGNLTALLSYRLLHTHDSHAWIDTSLSLPTADDDGTGALVGSAFALFWIPEPGLYLPNTTTFSAAYRHSLQRDGNGVEFSGGLQFLAIDGADDRLRVPLRVGGHVGLGPSAQAVGRFTTVWLPGADDGDDDFLHIVEAGIRVGETPRSQFEMLLYYPLDDLYRDTLETFGVTLGFRSAL